MLILKFGGSSVASKQRIKTICEIVQKELKNHPLVVVSALQGVTDLLTSFVQSPSKKILKRIKEQHFSLVHELFADKRVEKEVQSYILQKLTDLERIDIQKNNTLKGAMMKDQVLSFGEILASNIVASALESRAIKSKQVIATEFIVTNDHFGSAEFVPTLTTKRTKAVLNPLIRKGIVPVVTGFIGATLDNKITTLGRGGSDYTASILAYCLNAQEVQIWTDVNGIYSTDPRIVPNARLIEKISFREASEMATFGAKVLHPKTIRPAIQKNIPVRVLNTFNPARAGTLITASLANVKGLKAVTFKKKTTLINIYSTEMLFSKGYLARVFDIFAKEDISVDLVSVSEVSISVTLDDHLNISKVISELKKFATVTHTNSVGVVSLIGEDMISSDHILAEVSNLFHSHRILIKMISFGASNINISLVLESDEVEKAVKLLHNELFLKTKTWSRSNHIYGGGFEA